MTPGSPSPREAVDHLGRGLVGERDDEHLVRGHDLGRDRVRRAAADHARLAGARARVDRDGPARRSNRGFLLGIEVGQAGARIEGGEVSPHELSLAMPAPPRIAAAPRSDRLRAEAEHLCYSRGLVAMRRDLRVVTSFSNRPCVFGFCSGSGEVNVTTGTIKKVVADRGFGFITAEDAKEYFFHRNRLDSSLDFDRLVGGEKVQFEIEQSPKGPRASRVSQAA